MELGGKLQLDFTELTVSISDDGRILAQHSYTKEYYIVQNGVTTGPIRPGDKRLNGFQNIDESDSDTSKDSWLGNEYITKSGDKYLINFGGKTFGPYAQINNFMVTKSKDKFAALAIENIVVNDAQGKKMDEAIKNAKTEQEKMDLAIQYSQQIQQKMMQAGPTSTTPKLVTNIPDATFNPLMGGTMSASMKYDDILVNKFDKVTDFQDRTVIPIDKESLGADQIFINSDNSKYAVYKYGTLTFSNNKNTLSEMFTPGLIKENGQVYIAYMYYSPKKNAIMQCKIPF
jgi:hypothetical protein